VEYGTSLNPFCTSELRISSLSNVYVSRYGNSSMRDSSTIAFYSGPNFTGTLTELPVGNYSNTNINVGSYVFTGSSGYWLAYAAANYGGTGSCIAPQSRVISNGWGHTYEARTNMTIRSIRRVNSCTKGNTGSSSRPYFLAIFVSVIFATFWMK